MLVLVSACLAGKAKAPTVTTATIGRRDITISSDANGTTEPIIIVEIRSKASGMVTFMNAETGTHVKPNDVLVQVDTQIVFSQYQQAIADLTSAKAQVDVSQTQLKREKQMLDAKVITPTEYDGYRLTYETAAATLVRDQANLDIAKQSLEDATVKAPSEGTVIEKDVSVGNIIQSSITSAGGSTVLLRMADLRQIRIRAFFNETDVGDIRPGQQATVTVDAYPNRRFIGQVDKIEPEAVVQQGVTMFPGARQPRQQRRRPSEWE